MAVFYTYQEIHVAINLAVVTIKDEIAYINKESLTDVNMNLTLYIT